MSDGGFAELEWREAIAGSDGRSAWRPIATATIESVAKDAVLRVQPIDQLPVEQVSADSVYSQFTAAGAKFGPAFRCLSKIELGRGFARAQVELPEHLQRITTDRRLHPVLIDRWHPVVFFGDRGSPRATVSFGSFSTCRRRQNHTLFRPFSAT